MDRHTHTHTHIYLYIYIYIYCTIILKDIYTDILFKMCILYISCTNCTYTHLQHIYVHTYVKYMHIYENVYRLYQVYWPSGKSVRQWTGRRVKS